MRFNSAQHLRVWERTGSYPSIHQSLTNMVVTYLDRGSDILDLGCGFGLLGHAISTRTRGCMVLGIDANDKTIAAAKDAGLDKGVTFKKMRITPDNSHEVADLCKELKIKAVVARRVFPELFGNDPVALTIFGHQLAEAGIRQIFIQGRVPVKNPNNELPTVQEEAKYLRASFEPAVIHGDLAYLKAIKPLLE